MLFWRRRRIRSGRSLQLQACALSVLRKRTQAPLVFAESIKNRRPFFVVQRNMFSVLIRFSCPLRNHAAR